MIKVFRKIRQKLLVENRFSKYLLYAFGEIILVVIGILLALQFNSMKEQNDQRKIERDYLEGILSNLEDDIYELDNVLKQDTVMFEAYADILTPFQKDNFNVYSGGFIKAVGYSQFTHQFEGNSIVFEDMQSSGKINFIQSDALRFSLLEYYNLTRKNRDLQRKNNALIDQQREHAFTNNLDLNSLIETFIFNSEYKSEVDPLDLSFFNKNKDLPAVKDFSNRVSLMKALLRVNHNGNFFMDQRARKLRGLINDYLGGKEIDFTTPIPNAIAEAILKDDSSALKKLINHKNVKMCFEYQDNYPISLLSFSLEARSLDCAKLLIDEGSDLELACYDKTPLMYAVKYGHMVMVKYLIEKGVDVNKVSVEWNTALDYARRYKHPEIEVYLQKLISND